MRGENESSSLDRAAGPTGSQAGWCEEGCGGEGEGGREEKYD